MSTFYILPPRECLEQAVTSFLDRLIPGLPVPERLCERIFENLGENPDAFLVHREELSGLAELSEDLAENFGAEPEDRIIEVGMPHGTHAAPVRIWTMPRAVPDRPAA